MTEPLPTINDILLTAYESLDDIHRRLSETADLLRSPSADDLRLTPGDALRRMRMQTGIGEALAAVERAKS